MKITLIEQREKAKWSTTQRYLGPGDESLGDCRSKTENITGSCRSPAICTPSTMQLYFRGGGFVVPVVSYPPRPILVNGASLRSANLGVVIGVGAPDCLWPSRSLGDSDIAVRVGPVVSVPA